MKALTLTQPWAQLVALGEKRLETRSWSTRFRGPLAIHAGKNLKPVGGENGLALLCEKEPFRAALAEADLYFGAVVATCELIGCIPTTALDQATDLGVTPAEHERDFGDYSPGRWAWLLKNIEPTRPPHNEISGKQGLWNVGVKPSTEAARAAGMEQS